MQNRNFLEHKHRQYHQNHRIISMLDMYRRMLIYVGFYAKLSCWLQVSSSIGYSSHTAALKAQWTDKLSFKHIQERHYLLYFTNNLYHLPASHSVRPRDLKRQSLNSVLCCVEQCRRDKSPSCTKTHERLQLKHRQRQSRQQNTENLGEKPPQSRRQQYVSSCDKRMHNVIPIILSCSGCLVLNSECWHANTWNRQWT